MKDSYDAIIIGAGVVGCSIACALSKSGLSTLNVDTLPAAGYGSTSYSSAIVRPFYSHVTSCAIAHESRARWKHWSDVHTGPDPAAAYIESGGLVFIREGTRHEYEQNLSVLEEVGVNYDILDRPEIEKRHPGICLDAFGPPSKRDSDGFGQPTVGEISEAIYIPQAGYVTDSQLATRNLQQTAESHGADFMFGWQVSAIVRHNNKVEGIVGPTGHQIAAPIVINAAGPHSAAVNTLADVKLPIMTRPHRHEVAHLRAPDSFSGHPVFVADLDAGVYQRPDGVDMLIGSTDPYCDEPEIVDPDNYNASLTEQWTTQVYRAAQRWPDLAIENSGRGVVGLYDVSDDWIPIYDRTDLDGFYVAIGTSGNQFKNAPLIGEIMSAIITCEEHDNHPATLDLPNIGRSVNLSFFSRNRTIQTTSSVLA